MKTRPEIEYEIKTEINRVEAWMIGYCWENGVEFHPSSERWR